MVGKIFLYWKKGLGRKEGRKKGRKEGRKEGMKEGRKEGRKEGGPGYGTKGTLVLERIQYINPYVF